MFSGFGELIDRINFELKYWSSLQGDSFELVNSSNRHYVRYIIKDTLCNYQKFQKKLNLRRITEKDIFDFEGGKNH